MKCNIKYICINSLKLISEVDTLLNAFKFITTNASWDDVFHPPSETARERGSTLAKQFAGAYPALSTSGQLRPWPYMINVEENDKEVREYEMPRTVQYPAILTMVGSTLFIGKVRITHVPEYGYFVLRYMQ